MKLSRLYRPQDRRFWLMIVLNLLSAVLAWFLRSWPEKLGDVRGRNYELELEAIEAN